MDVPDCHEWIAMRDAAKKMHVSVRKVHNCRMGRVKSVTGSVVVLQAWKTPAGWVTTDRAIKEFVNRLNM